MTRALETKGFILCVLSLVFSLLKCYNLPVKGETSQNEAWLLVVTNVDLPAH